MNHFKKYGGPSRVIHGQRVFQTRANAHGQKGSGQTQQPSGLSTYQQPSGLSTYQQPSGLSTSQQSYGLTPSQQSSGLGHGLVIQGTVGAINFYGAQPSQHPPPVNTQRRSNQIQIDARPPWRWSQSDTQPPREPRRSIFDRASTPPCQPNVSQPRQRGPTLDSALQHQPRRSNNNNNNQDVEMRDAEGVERTRLGDGMDGREVDRFPLYCPVCDVHVYPGNVQGSPNERMLLARASVDIQ
ncbi:uncharacterized protein J3D65DRAFT_373175 [Phyllosticta citribraziliensis]|uniref:Uncharacterized protein n=1 Tax=Phyllosticta citribraziliensis TaxID=989973 RepID=A0ABR1LR89_9PEZI